MDKDDLLAGIDRGENDFVTDYHVVAIRTEL